MILAIGCKPSSLAFAFVKQSSAAGPSFNVEEFPAVTVPFSFRKAV